MGCKTCCWEPLKGCIDAILQNELVKIVRLVFTLAMAVTSYTAVFNEFDQKVVNQKLSLSFQPPDDRCVPYFDKAEQLMEGQEPKSILYSYVDGEPQVSWFAVSASRPHRIGCQWFGWCRAVQDQHWQPMPVCCGPGMGLGKLDWARGTMGPNRPAGGRGAT
jgi:hypothetical protein